MLLDHPLLIVVLIAVFPAAVALLAYLTADGDASYSTSASHSTAEDAMGTPTHFAPDTDWGDDNSISSHQFGSDSMAHRHINPATGLPMLGSLDVEGNPYGTSGHDNSMFDINPANGLPMLDSMLDIQGNPYGTDVGIFDSFYGHDSLGSYDSFDNLDSFDSFHSHFDD
ncbi:MAG: hypothetical protein Kow0096_25750 [Thiohalomonadaceae bacterium]